MKKALTHLKLEQANPTKRQKLDELAAEYMQVAQAYINWLIDHEMREPDKYAPIPEKEIPTLLSDRWQRCAWMHPTAIMASRASLTMSAPRQNAKSGVRKPSLPAPMWMKFDCAR